MPFAGQPTAQYLQSVHIRTDVAHVTKDLGNFKTFGDLDHGNERKRTQWFSLGFVVLQRTTDAEQLGYAEREQATAELPVRRNGVGLQVLQHLLPEQDAVVQDANEPDHWF